MFPVFITIYLIILVPFHFSNCKLLRDVMSLFFWGENLLKKVNIERKSKHFLGYDSAWKRPVSVLWFQHCLDNLIGLHSRFFCVHCPH